MPHEPGSTLKPLVRLPRDPAKCWTWLGNHSTDGVPMKQFNGRRIPARRWLWAQLFGPIKKGRVISMTCGNNGCINPAHMRECTQAEAVRAGIGTTATPGDVEQVREMWDAGYPHAEIIKQTGLTRGVVAGITSGESWQRAKPFAGPIQPRNQYTGEGANRDVGAGRSHRSGSVRRRDQRTGESAPLACAAAPT